MRPTLLRALFLSLIGLTTTASATLSVAPIKIEKAVTETDNVLEFVVSNHGEKPVQLTLSTAALGHDRSGVPVEVAPGSRFDLSSKIRFEKSSVTLPAKRWKRLRARVDVPHRSGGGAALIYVRAQDAEARLDSTGVVAAYQIGIVVAVTFPDKGQVSMKVEDLQLDPDGLRVSVRNQGDALALARGHVKLTDTMGRTVWEGNLVAANVFPDHVRLLELNGAPPALASGEYQLTAELTSPVNDQVVRAASFVDGQLKLAPASGIAKR